MINSANEARRLLAKGFKLCLLHPMSKRPVGDNWNHSTLTNPGQVSDDAGGFGIPLALNNLCSVDFDNAPVAEAGLRACGIDPEWLRMAGVATSSTRPGSGGRVAFRVPEGSGLRWLRFTNKVDGTILELRASSANLQDCMPGTTYRSVDGSGPWVQDYAGLWTFDEAPPLPERLLSWWQRMSGDLEYLHSQQKIIAGPKAQLDVSSGATLAFSSPHRMRYNEENTVEEILTRHGYSENRGRFAPPTATGSPGVRLIQGRDDLWQSDHASDPLFGSFDAWTAHVALDHDGDLAAAEAAADVSRALVAVEGFSEVPVPAAPPPDDATSNDPADVDLPAFDRAKNGQIKATVNNLLMALHRPDLTKIDIGMDAFRDEIMIASAGTNRWRTFADADYVFLRAHLELGMNGFAPIGRELIRDAVLAVAEQRRFDSAILWLNQLKWDGVPRIDSFFADLFGAEDTPYNRAVSAYLWTAMAGRILAPGCKADMVPILVGLQGAGKSTAVAAMAPSVEFFTEVSFAEKDDDLARKMRGKLIAEIGELRGLHTKDLEAIKAFVTRTHEHWIPKYREFQTTFPRRLVFVGTTNRDQFLADDTGNRRWLPVKVDVANVDLVRKLAPQCWAEAAIRFLMGGVEWNAAQQLATEVHDEFAYQDEWESSVRAWLSTPAWGADGQKKGVTTHQALFHAVGVEVRNVTRHHEQRMGSLLRKIGFERKKVRVDGVPQWRFLSTPQFVPMLENDLGTP